MNKTVKYFVVGVGVLLLLRYMKNKKKETAKELPLGTMSVTEFDQKIDQIRIRLLDYIERRNYAENKDISRENIDHDIQLITKV